MFGGFSDLNKVLMKISNSSDLIRGEDERMQVQTLKIFI